MEKFVITFVSITLLLADCGTTTARQATVEQGNTPQTMGTEGWGIPVEHVLEGGPGRDGIPALDTPVFTAAENTGELQDTDLVLGYKNGEDVRAYPHRVLDWHEIVNDELGDVSLAVTYCPLTGTGIGWNRSGDKKKTTFGVSGLLYNSNLIPYDRETGSNWSQILGEAVNGKLLGRKADLIQLVETDWKTWKTMYPNTRVLNLDTGFSRSYGVYPYGDYRTNHDLFIFPVPRDGRLPSKERVHALIDGKVARVYRFRDLIAEKMVRDKFNGKEYLIVGNGDFIVSFELEAETASLNFQYTYSGFQGILTDDEGNEWNIFGEATHGPRRGQELKTSRSFMGYWFSIPAFYSTDIYGL